MTSGVFSARASMALKALPTLSANPARACKTCVAVSCGSGRGGAQGGGDDDCEWYSED